MALLYQTNIQTIKNKRDNNKSTGPKRTKLTCGLFDTKILSVYTKLFIRGGFVTICVLMLLFVNIHNLLRSNG